MKADRTASILITLPNISVRQKVKMLKTRQDKMMMHNRLKRMTTRKRIGYTKSESKDYASSH